MVRVMLVLKSGKEYVAQHVLDLAQQIDLYLPNTPVHVLSDIAIPNIKVLPLKHNWPGWWSKMELFRPDIEGDLLYIDLDTVIIDDISDFAKVNRLTLIRDFYRDGVRRPKGLGSGVMFLPKHERETIWKHWVENPELIIRDYKRRGVGDQAFLERFWMNAACWQELLPNQLVSFKVHCRNGIPPKDARMVAYHGRPKPWEPAGQLREIFQ